MRREGTRHAGGQGSGKCGTPEAARAGAICVVVALKTKYTVPAQNRKNKQQRGGGHLASLQWDGRRPAGGQGREASAEQHRLPAAFTYIVVKSAFQTRIPGNYPVVSVSIYGNLTRITVPGTRYLGTGYLV